MIPLTTQEQWPVPSDVDSRHNPDGGHLSEATSLYFSLHLLAHSEPALLRVQIINGVVQQG